MIARILRALAAWMESKASAGDLARRIQSLEARMASTDALVAQCRVDMAKCKMIVGLNQVLDTQNAE